MAGRPSQGTTEAITVMMTPQQAAGIRNSARRAGVKVSEYVRKSLEWSEYEREAITLGAETMSKTTHRASFPIPGENNEFYTENSQYCIIDTRTENIAHSMTKADTAKFAEHTRTGFHPECVICLSKNVRDLAAQIDPRTPEQIGMDADAADQAATYRNAL